MAWLTIALQIVVSCVTYPFLPEQVPSHWNAAGQIDGYMPKLANAILLPAISIALYLFIQLLIRYSPRLGQQNQRTSLEVVNLIIVGVLVFLLIVQLSITAIALGMAISIPFVISLCLSVLFLFLGNYMGKLRRNFWAGFRTPWTLASDTVWERTHRVGGWLMALAGLLGIILSFIPPLRLWGLLALIGIVIVATTVYSFVLYQRLSTEGKEPLSPPFDGSD